MRKLWWVLVLSGCGEEATGPERITTILPACVLFCRSEVGETQIKNLPTVQSVTNDSSFSGGAGGQKTTQVGAP